MKTPINILHLEDDPTDAALVQSRLEEEGVACTIKRVDNRSDFQSALEQGRFDLIISDYSLPSFDGFQAMELARRLDPDMPIIFLSGTLGEETAVESLRRGAVDYVLKDRLTRLGASVRRAVEEAAEREERRRIEEQFRKQDELFRRIGENAEDLVAVLDVEGRRVYNSPSYRKLLGDPQSLVGTVSFAEIHPDDRERIQRIFRETVATGAGQRAEYRFVLNDGSIRFVESQGSVIRDKQGRVANVVVISRDVTGRRQAEEALRESERLLRLVIDLVPHFIFAKDATGRHLFGNRACAEAHGLTPEQMVGRHDHDLVADRAQAEAFTRDDQEVIASGRPKLIPEERFTDRAGAMRFLQTIKIPFAAPGTGEPALLGVAVDITERKRAEEALRQAEEKYRSIFENAVEGIFQTTPDGEFLAANPAMARILGYASPEELIGNRSDIARQGYVDPTRREEFKRLIEARGVVNGFEYEVYRKDGSKVWVSENARAIRDESGHLIHYEGSFVDITGRKQAEARLATQHAVTRALAESAGVPDTSKKILQTICHNLHWDVGELWTLDRTSNALRCVEIWHPPSTEFKEFVDSSRQTTFARGVGLPGRVWASRQAAWIPDVTKDPGFPRADMATRLGLHTGFGFPIQMQGEILGVLAFFSAKTRESDDDSMAMFTALGSQIGSFIERKQIEEQFRQAQKMEAFGQLAGGVAHDFNNILAVIMGYSNILMGNEEFKPEAKEQLKQVYSAGERAANLTRQLLTFSRKKEMQVSPLGLNEVIRNMTKMLGRIIGEDIRLQCNYASNLPTIQADEGMMEQVVMNLAVNARDAMAQGGQLNIGTERVVTDADYVRGNPEARDGEFVCLSVQDTGCGMTPEIQARIFEPFFTTKAVGKGTGLGLATVFGIVKQHQGWLEVESQVGTGTVFKVFLPASLRPFDAAVKAGAESKIRGGNETILLVEDEAALRELTKIILQRHGYGVLEATSGVQALEVWEAQAPRIDLLLTDMIMPDGLTGRELAKQLLAKKPGLKVIYTSGYSMESEETSFRAREATTFLQKPYHPQKLLQAVREALEAK